MDITSSMSLSVCSEYFGAERVISGDEDKKAEAESEEEGKMARDKSTSSIVPAKSDPE